MASITILRRSVVAPAVPTSCSSASLPLSNFDLALQNSQYNQRILLYSQPQGLDYFVSENLKKSLAQALVYFNPLAGRLSDIHTHPGRLNVLCNDAGAEFIEARSEVTLSEMLDCRKSPALYELVPMRRVTSMDGVRLPLLVVQATELNGGLALGFAMNHILADGQSAWHFMKSWAELCKGKDVITINPIWDRSIIEEDDPTMDHYSLKRLTSSHAPFTSDSVLQERVIHFSANAVAKVKEEANANTEDGKTISSYQALGAYLWKLITIARNLAPEDTTGFNVVAECRRRLEPPVPSAYFGNALRILRATTTVKDLEERDLSYAAKLLKNAIEECNAESIRSHINRLKENGYSWQ